MKNVKLSAYECKVIAEALDPYKICRAGCYCDYKRERNCFAENENGVPYCKMMKAIDNILKKIDEI